MRVKSGLINDAASAAQPKEETMSEVTREEFEELRRSLENLMLMVAEIERPERQFVPAPTVEIAPSPTQQHPAVDFPRGVFALVCDQLAADLGTEGLDKLQEGVTHYTTLYQAMHPKIPVSSDEIGKAWGMAWRIGAKFDQWPTSVAGEAIRGCLFELGAFGVDEPLMWEENPVTHKRRLVGIPASMQWLAKLEAALHTGGSGQLPPTPVKPKE